MYIATCPGGFPIPTMIGQRREIIGIKATVSTTTSASRLVLIDDTALDENEKFGRTLPSTHDKGTKICDIKGIASVDANLEVLFPEPLQTRHGVSLVEATNLVVGSIMVYVR